MIIPKSVIHWSTSLHNKSLVIKIILWVLGSLLLSGFSLLLFFRSADIDTQKQIIETAIEQQFAAEFNAGELQWSRLSLNSLELGPSQLSIKNGDVIADLPKIKISLSLLSIFKQRLTINTIELNQPEFVISTNNWHHWRNALLPKTTPSIELKSVTDFDLKIHQGLVKLIINDQNFDFTALDAEVTEMNSNTASLVSITGIAMASETPFQLNARLTSQNPQVLKIEEFLFTQDMSPYTTTASTLEVQLKGSYELEKDELSITKASIDLDRFYLKANAKIENLFSKPELTLEFPNQKPGFGQALQLFRGRTSKTNHMITIGDTIRIKGGALLNQKGLGLLLEPVLINNHYAKLDLQLDYQTYNVQANVDLANLDLRPILDPDESALVTNTKVEKNTPAINVLALPLSQQLLEKFSGNINIAIKNLFHSQFQIENFSAQIQGDDGHISFNRATFQAFEGNMRAYATLNATREPIIFTLRHSAERLAVDELLSRLAENNWIQGELDYKIDIISSGMTLNELLVNSNGTLDVRMREGVIPGADLFQVALNNVNQLSGTLSRDERASFHIPKTLNQDRANIPGQTRVNDFFASLDISKELISTSNALIKVNGFATTATIEYAKQKNTLIFSMDLPLASKNMKYNGLLWPVSCKLVNWNLPHCGVNIQLMQERLNNSAGTENLSAIP